MRLAHRPHALFLDSALRDPELGRYSFLAADPFDFLSVPVGRQRSADGADPLALLASRLAPWQAETVPGLPPFQGGAAGLWAYDLNRSLEQIAPAGVRRIRGAGARRRTVRRGAGLRSSVGRSLDHLARISRARTGGTPPPGQPSGPGSCSRGWPSRRRNRCRRRRPRGRSRPIAWRPALPRPGRPDLVEQFFGRRLTSAMVERAIEYIRAGDVFQVNLSQRLLFPARESAVALYLRLRRCNPAPFAGYFDLGEFQIASASPERFLKVAGGEVETRPIKGTRQRTRQPEADLFAGDELSQSEKDRAENVMIVDLMRNDLAKVCQADSVRVTQLCQLESYAVRAAPGLGGARPAASPAAGRSTCCGPPFRADRSAERPRCGRCKSLPNWNRPPAGRIVEPWATSASTARPTPIC